MSNTGIWNWLKRFVKKPDNFEQLAKIGIFSDLTSFQMQQVSNYVNHREFKKSEKLFEEGFPLNAIYFIEQGSVQLSGGIYGSNSKALTAGAYIGLVDMFSEGFRSCDATALTQLSVLTISKEDLWYLIKSDKSLGIKILSGCCSHLSRILIEKDTTQSDTQ